MPNSLLAKPLPCTDRLRCLATSFRLPTVADQAVPRFTAAGHQESLQTLLEVFELEAQDRRERRVDRFRKAAKLPPGKTFDTLDQTRLPRSLSRQLKELATGDFIARSANILAFGLPGVGKTHAIAAIGDALVTSCRSVYFAKTFELVQDLLGAKRDLALPRALRKLDAFEVLILDDIGYVQQNADEVEVLFTLLAERYERRSTIITSNLVFSEWDQIFKNPMTTAAAIDRIVHHSVILEFNVSSFRTEQAKKRRAPAQTEQEEES